MFFIHYYWTSTIIIFILLKSYTLSYYKYIIHIFASLTLRLFDFKKQLNSKKISYQMSHAGVRINAVHSQYILGYIWSLVILSKCEQ